MNRLKTCAPQLPRLSSKHENPTMDPQTLAYYSQNASAISQRYESITNGLATSFEAAFKLGARVLDIGCGSGRDLALLLRISRDAYGLEACPELIAAAHAHHPELEQRIEQGALPNCTMPFGGNFDGILCSAMLMHIEPQNYEACVAFIWRALKPQGILLYSVPSARGDVDESNNRDAAGRLFVADAAQRLKTLFLAHGFKLIEEFENEDSLGRDGVRWASVLMQRP